MSLFAEVAKPEVAKPDVIKQRGMHIARRSVANRFTPRPQRVEGEPARDPDLLKLHSAPGPMRRSLPEVSQPAHACPIWFAALIATTCLAAANGENRAICWDCVSGRAVYTNRGGDAERIEPL